MQWSLDKVVISFVAGQCGVELLLPAVVLIPVMVPSAGKNRFTAEPLPNFPLYLKM